MNIIVDDSHQIPKFIKEMSREERQQKLAVYEAEMIKKRNDAEHRIKLAKA
jgi:hypothetical protein